MGESVAVVKKECARILKMAAHPNRRVQGGGKPVACFNRGDKARLKRERRPEPYVRQQKIARSEAMIERADRSAQSRSHRVDRHRGRAAFRSEVARGRKKVGFLEETFRHLLESSL